MATAPQPTPKLRRWRSFLRALFRARGRQGELLIISHSNLFYWWPVWLAGFVLAIVTFAQDARLATVPAGTVAARNRQVEVMEPDGKLKLERRDVLIAPPKQRLPAAADDPDEVSQPTIRIAHSKEPGVLFTIILLVVIAVSSIPLRGLWSLLTVLVLFLWVIIFAQLGLWESIFGFTRHLAIHMNMGGYIFLSVTLLILWLIGLLFFDRQFYVIVTPGQVRVHLEIGGGETVYDTGGMVFQKKRSDIFRHWVLGFGSGDLIIQPANTREHIDLPNVIFVARRVREIEARLKEKAIVAA